MSLIAMDFPVVFISKREFFLYSEVSVEVFAIRGDL